VECGNCPAILTRRQAADGSRYRVTLLRKIGYGCVKSIMAA